MFSVLQVPGGPWASCNLREKARNVFLISSLSAFFISPSIPAVTMISIQRGQLVSLAAVWVNRTPHSTTLCSTSSARKIMLGYCWTSHCPFCHYHLYCCHFPCSITSFVVQSIHFWVHNQWISQAYWYMLCRGTFCCLWMSD